MKKQIIIMAGIICLALGLPAAAITHNILTSYQTQSGSLTGTASVTSDTEQNADVTMTGGGTNVVLTVALNTTNAQTLALFATTDCTVAFYNATTPWKTNSLTANTPSVAVGSNQIYTAIGTNVITSLKLSCSSNTCTFSLRSIVHNGP